MGNCNGSSRKQSFLDDENKTNTVYAGSTIKTDVKESNNASTLNGNSRRDDDKSSKSGYGSFYLDGDSSAHDDMKLSGRSSGTDSCSSNQRFESVHSVASSVHSNLMRTHVRRDPMKYYEVVSILGKGSMGSVAKVKKKDSAVGGSARSSFVQENHGVCFDYCNRFCPPLLSLLQSVTHKQDVLLVPSTKLTEPHEEDVRKEPKANDQQDKSMGHNIPTPETSSSRSKKQVTYASDPSSSEVIVPTVTETIPVIPTNYSSKVDQVIDTGGFNSSYISTITKPESSISTASNWSTTAPKNPKTIKHQYSSIITYGTGKQMYFALKSIHLERCSSVEFMEELKNEVEILKQLDHPNVVRAIETFAYKGRLFLLLELCQGGDLYTRDPYSEDDAKKIVTCILSAVTYLHTKGVVHRDLKFENICFSDQSADAEVRIIDFGLSQKFASNEHLHEAVGTVYTMAPELLKGDYGSKVDIWSIGVIAFSLLSSSLPFYGEDRITVMKKILRGKYRFSSRRWATISLDAKNFIHSLLNPDPEERPTGLQAMDTIWIKGSEDGVVPFTIQEIEQMDKIQESIQRFAIYPTLKKLALMMVAYKSTSEEVGYLRKMFSKYDLAKDGEITLPEFKAVLVDHYDYSDEEIENLFNGIDIDGTGKVHYIEFVAATIEAHGAIDEERLAEAFDRIDSDDSGYITVSDLRSFLGQDIPQGYIEKIINEADILHDHRVSYEEFLELWSKDADDELRNNMADIKRRRKAYPSSVGRIGDNFSAVSSSISSGDEMTLSDDDDQEEGDKQLKSDFYFSQRKFQSMRKVEIDMKGIEIGHDHL